MLHQFFEFLGGVGGVYTSLHMSGSAIHFLFTFRMRIEYELGLSLKFQSLAYHKDMNRYIRKCNIFLAENFHSLWNSYRIF